ncbi:MAG: 2,3-diaminopropionate biosynthesis protein SbnB [Desulfobacteraceae bacterium]|nr:MAG: 2,3-diaminopropionate biosynthesis protein SbnB [Desulfobacteraceae bacterium]
MLYLDEKDVLAIGINWRHTIAAVEKAVRCLSRDDFAQPIKPYLRYRDLKNRIIAMPAFVGGEFNIAGIKWIASFPDNIHKGIPRAHSLIVLNDADNGKPVAVLNTALLSVIRTASVTGLMIQYFDQARNIQDARVGITGWGPIGQYHLKMCAEVFGAKISGYSIFDLKAPDLSGLNGFCPGKAHAVKSWEDAYQSADLFMTCTVSKESYIDRKPKEGSLQLNISLRDYKTSVYEFIKESVIVDDWDEVCREKTDIEMFHEEKGLQKEHTKSIADVVVHGCLNDYPRHLPIMFNPMGMGLFDIAIAHHYYNEAKRRNIGINL